MAEVNKTPNHLLEVAKLTAPGIFHAYTWGLTIGEDIIADLKHYATLVPQRRARLCMHPDVIDKHHEMLIVAHRTSIERPQYRSGGFDTKVVLEGTASYRFHHGDGAIREEIELSSTGTRYTHVRGSGFHSLMVLSDWFVFLEIADGPWDPSRTVKIGS